MGQLVPLYSSDTLHKSGLTRAVADSKLKYAAPFSKTSRWGGCTSQIHLTHREST
jgi:hypothetical protein